MKRVLSLNEVDALKKVCRDNTERELIDALSMGARLSDIAQETGANRFYLLARFKEIVARVGMASITPHDLRRKFYQYEFYIKGGYDFSALSAAMEVVK